MKHGMTRREGVALLLGAGAQVLAGGAARSAPSPSLDALAKAKGLSFGSNAGMGPDGSRTGSFADPRYRDLLSLECGVLVPENELKWQHLRPAPDVFDFAPADMLIAFAEAHGMAIRGHNLLWHRPKWLPAWVNGYDFGPRPSEAAEALLATHIRTVCRRYGDRIASWDVINEAIDPATGQLAETVFSHHIGPEVIDLCFRLAREAAPHAELVYNDYMSWGAGDERHRTGVLKLLERLKARGVPVDALGVQSHIGPDSDGPARPVAVREAEWRRFLDEVTGMGLKLLITELDVNDIDLLGDIAARDAAVAAYAKGYLEMMLAYPQLRNVMTWGLDDRYSWLQDRSPRKDGLPKRPTPYDADFKAKPLREAIASALRSAPGRRA
jgi:endo-1,4-beta-xylanase